MKRKNKMATKDDLNLYENNVIKVVLSDSLKTKLKRRGWSWKGIKALINYLEMRTVEDARDKIKSMESLSR